MPKKKIEVTEHTELENLLANAAGITNLMDAATDTLDSALDAAEAHLQKLLPALTPHQIASAFADHARTHLPDELANIGNHGHRNDDPTDVRPELISHQSARVKNAIVFVNLVARMQTEQEFGNDSPPSEDWIGTLNDLIVEARKIADLL